MHPSRVSSQRIVVFVLASIFSTIILSNNSSIIVCDQNKNQKLCLTLESSPDDKIWLWITPSCKESCQFQHNDIIKGFQFVEKLPAKEFGIELVSNEKGDMYWSGCSLNKEEAPMTASVVFPVTRHQHLNTSSNETRQSLLNDLARVLPNSQELMRQRQQIQAEDAWGKFILTHILAASIPLITLYCCLQC